jgi:two-component sensor histidine kinase/PAS domain-containing protein
VLDRLLAAIAWARRLPGWVRFAAASPPPRRWPPWPPSARGSRALFALPPPVLAAGLLFNRLAGLLAAVLAGGAGVVLFTRPAGALAIDDPRDLAAAAVFLAVALGVAWLVEALHASLVRHAAAEARWRGLVEALPGFTWTAAPDGRLDWTSPGWHAYAGECGGDWQAHIHPADRARVLEGWAAAVAARAPGHEDEVRLRAADGTYRWFLARAVPVRRHGGGGAAAGAPPPRWVGTCTDVDERRRAEERRRVLVDELNHRVKNTLSVVQSLARQTARGAASPAAFVPAFEARLFALSAAHDLLTRRDWAGATVAELAAAVLAPHLPAGRVALSGPQALHLGTRGAVALAMALGELAANAARHGALSVPAGRVEVSWQAMPAGEGGGAGMLRWQETGGPELDGAPPPAARRGFGLRLLTQGLRADLGGAAELCFARGGLRCTIRLPTDAAAAPPPPAPGRRRRLMPAAVADDRRRGARGGARYRAPPLLAAGSAAARSAAAGPAAAGAAAGAAAAAGSHTRKTLPFPSSLSISSTPRCRFTMCFTMASPSPVPPIARPRPLSTR